MALGQIGRNQCREVRSPVPTRRCPDEHDDPKEAALRIHDGLDIRLGLLAFANTSIPPNICSSIDRDNQPRRCVCGGILLQPFRPNAPPVGDEKACPVLGVANCNHGAFHDHRTGHHSSLVLLFVWARRGPPWLVQALYDRLIRNDRACLVRNPHRSGDGEVNRTTPETW
jgi:hypothetical protein